MRMKTAGVVGHAQVGRTEEFLEHLAGVLEEGFAQTQLDGFKVAHALAGQGLADDVQEGGGFAELDVGDLRGLEFFLVSGAASRARVS